MIEVFDFDNKDIVYVNVIEYQKELNGSSERQRISSGRAAWFSARARYIVWDGALKKLSRKTGRVREKKLRGYTINGWGYVDKENVSIILGWMLC